MNQTFSRRNGPSKTVMISPSPSFLTAAEQNQVRNYNNNYNQNSNYPNYNQNNSNNNNNNNISNNGSPMRSILSVGGASDARVLEPPSPGIHRSKEPNRYLNVMKKVAFTDHTYENQIEKNYELLRGKMFTDKKEAAKLNLDQELLERSQLRASKYSQDNELQERYINYRERANELTSRLNNAIMESRLERDNYNDLYSKLRGGIQPEFPFTATAPQNRDLTASARIAAAISGEELDENDLIDDNNYDEDGIVDALQKKSSQPHSAVRSRTPTNELAVEKQPKFQFPLAQSKRNQWLQQQLQQKTLQKQLQLQAQLAQAKKTASKTNGEEGGKQNDEKSDERPETDEDVTDGDTVMKEEDRSNFDDTSMISRSKSPLQMSYLGANGDRECEYSSQREYNITEIQKLTEIAEYEILPNFLNNQKDPLTDAQEEQYIQDSEQLGKSKEKPRTNQMKRKRITNSKVEKSQDELNECSLNEKIDYYFYYDTIEKISLCQLRNSEIHPENFVQYQREISDQAREVLCVGEQFRGQYYEEMRMDLLQIDDIYIDENFISFDDVSNIISNRIPENMLFRPFDKDFLSDHFNRFSQLVEHKNPFMEDLLYTNQIHEIKQFQFQQMKSYVQKTKTWENKEQQSSYMDIVSETKSVTDWLMEDLYHIRKATLSSQGFDLDRNVSKVLQTQLYHKFEEKLMLLLQIILYRENEPVWRVPKKKKQVIQEEFDVDKYNEEQKFYREERLRIEALSLEQEKKFERLHHTEVEMIKDLKLLLGNINSLQDKFVDRRQKSELLRIFLVDYNEIVKFKNHQLSKITEIDSQIEEIDKDFKKVKGITVFQRLYEARIGQFNPITGKKTSDQTRSQSEQLDGFLGKVISLNQKRESILMGAAQIFKVQEDPKANKNATGEDGSRGDKSKLVSPKGVRSKSNTANKEPNNRNDKSPKSQTSREQQQQLQSPTNTRNKRITLENSIKSTLQSKSNIKRTKSNNNNNQVNNENLSRPSSQIGLSRTSSALTNRSVQKDRPNQMSRLGDRNNNNNNQNVTSQQQNQNYFQINGQQQQNFDHVMDPQQQRMRHSRSFTNGMSPLRKTPQQNNDRSFMENNSCMTTTGMESTFGYGNTTASANQFNQTAATTGTNGFSGRKSQQQLIHVRPFAVTPTKEQNSKRNAAHHSPYHKHAVPKNNAPVPSSLELVNKTNWKKLLKPNK